MKRILAILALLIGSLWGSASELHAAAITQTATGNWSSTATWVGGVVPGDGDTVTLLRSASITVDVDTTVGASGLTGGTPAITWTGSATVACTLTVAAGKTLRLRGDLHADGNDGTASHSITVVLSAGASLIFDPASGQRYVYYQDWYSFLVCNGTSGSHCTVTTDLARGGTAASFSIGGSSISGLKTASYTDFSNFGTSSIIGLWVYIASLSTLNSFSVTDCTFTQCSFKHANVSNPDVNITFSRNRFTNSRVTSLFGANGCCEFDLRAPTSSTRTVDHNSFDAQVILDGSAAGSTAFSNNYFGAMIQTNNSTFTADYFNNNFIAYPDNNGTVGYASNAKDCYHLGTLTGTNQHYAATLAGVTLTGMIFQAGPADNDSGDCVFPPATGATTLLKCLAIPNPSASGIFAAGNLLSDLGAGTGPFTVEHCLTFGPADGGALVKLGESGTARLGAVASCRSNIHFTNSASVSSYLIDQSTSTQVDVVTVADYNAKKLPTTGTITCNGVSQSAPGYSGLRFTAAGYPNSNIGTHDFTADPQFIDPRFRNVALWGADLQGTDGTYAAALATLAADPSLIAGMITWVRAGYAPKNALYKNATYPGDALTTDANGNALGGAVGPMAVVSSSVPAGIGGGGRLGGIKAGIKTGGQHFAPEFDFGDFLHLFGGH